jgi:hypothetical protein
MKKRTKNNKSKSRNSKDSMHSGMVTEYSSSESSSIYDVTNDFWHLGSRFLNTKNEESKKSKTLIQSVRNRQSGLRKVLSQIRGFFWLERRQEGGLLSDFGGYVSA